MFLYFHVYFSQYHPWRLVLHLLFLPTKARLSCPGSINTFTDPLFHMLIYPALPPPIWHIFGSVASICKSVSIQYYGYLFQGK